MAQRLGAHADRLQGVRELSGVKGRREQHRFTFEGATLLEEAVRSGTPVEDIYVTETVYGTNAEVRSLESRGVQVFIVEDRSAARISDLDTPTGLVAVAPIRLAELAHLLAPEGVVLVLADLNDPGNAGTLLRSAEAFGATGVIFGSLGVDPYHPKVVRSAMGALFRMPITVAEPGPLRDAVDEAGGSMLGLTAAGNALRRDSFARRCALVVGHERRGLGRFQPICDKLAAIPMTGEAESLNAAVAGSIGLYEAAKPL